MAGPNLAEVMQHDGPICARGPSGRGPVSLVRIRLCFISAAFRDKRGALCRHTYRPRRPQLQTALGGREPRRLPYLTPLFAHGETEVRGGAGVRGGSIPVTQ